MPKQLTVGAVQIFMDVIEEKGPSVSSKLKLVEDLLSGYTDYQENPGKIKSDILTMVLGYAARKNCYEAVEFCLRNGADSSVKVDGITPLVQAIRSKSYRSASMIMRWNLSMSHMTNEELSEIENNSVLFNEFMMYKGVITNMKNSNPRCCRHEIRRILISLPHENINFSGISPTRHI